MKTKHTPGPWTIQEWNNGVSQISYEVRGIADLHKRNGEDLANAKLIAAAPELLNAALMAITYLTKVNCGDEGDQAWQYLEQAIKKATE